jgi:PadR family transcriptional regulator PadR
MAASRTRDGEVISSLPERQHQNACVWPGTLTLMILGTLEAVGPLHGYGIARRIEEASLNRLTLNHGSIHPVLVKLEQNRFVTARWPQSENNRRARYYTLTETGRRQLGREAREWHKTANLIAALQRLP